jgi:FtsP/CotA-like multicopper oxidase with cupredoxin domain
VLTAVASLAGTAMAQMAMMNHDIEGITGPTFNLTAKAGYITAGDGNSIYFWGFANGDGTVQYPGPTLIVNQGQTVTVNLNNTLPVPVSIVFPGQKVVPTGGTVGLLTREAPAGTVAVPGGPVTYSFIASLPGTYMYNSGTRPDLQIEMGLVGAIIVRPTGFNAASTTGLRKAYSDSDPDDAGSLLPDSSYDSEYLFLLTEMDEKIHDEVEAQVLQSLPIVVDTTKYFPVYWFINGRTAPDTMLASGSDTPWLATQPYNCMPMMHPGQKLLMRVISGGRDPHPFHHHGNHSRMIARDGRLLSSRTGGRTVRADLSELRFTIPAFPGTTTDAIFTWTGEKLGWDMYGHSSTDELAPYEYAPDHGKSLPTVLPAEQQVTYGQMYGGSPFLGSAGILPPGEGGFNANNGFMYMWHSHAEKEIVNNDIFPGGMLTMLMIEAWPMTMP